MPNRKKQPIRNSPSWQTYQSNLQRKAALKKVRNLFLKFSPVLTIAVLVVYGLAVVLSSTACRQIFQHSLFQPQPAVEDSREEEKKLLSKKKVQKIIDDVDLLSLDQPEVSVKQGDHAYFVQTTIQPSLQQFLAKRLDTRYARDIGIVVMDPKTGKIHALAGFDKTGAKANPCTEGLYPAASIFKIVTAVAGIEKCGFSTGSRFTFNGGKYTLYKSQLRERKNRYTNRISLKDSFAQSVNPVFGKIGANYLGKENLVDYAESFGFNRAIRFEVPLRESVLHVTDKSYQWAEVACGFNRQTIMTPLHGALISAAIANNGILVEPSVVNRIVDQEGRVVYRNEKQVYSCVATPNTSKAVYEMMRATVRSGTSRKAFRGARRDSILSKLTIGGKTGSIGSRKIAHVRYDWFVGFADEKQGNEKLVVAVVVAHEKYIGKRAGYYARSAIKQYFRQYFDRQQAEMHTYNTNNGRKNKPV